MESDGDIGISQIAPAIHVELSDSIHVEVGTKRLVEELNRRYSWMRGMVIPNLVQDSNSVGDAIALSPADIAIFARVVETILRLGC